MKRLLLCTLLCSLTAFAKQNDSCFRAILATDTRAEGIEDSTVCDLDHMKKSLSAIAHHLHLKPYIQIVKGSDCSVHTIKKSLRSFQRNSNDIVLFYYSGHGGMDPYNSPWPVMYPSRSIREGGLLGASVVKYFQDNPHRLSIVLLDCCNESVCAGPYATITKEKFVIEANEDLPGLRCLFLTAKGLIIASGACHGEYGRCGRGGSVFTNSFLKALKVKCRRDAICWEELFSEISNVCLKLNPKHPQHPILQKLP